MASKMSTRRVTHCVGSPTFAPAAAIEDRDAHCRALEALQANDLEKAIKAWFNVPDRDDYVYHAMVSVQLAQVQRVVSVGGANGLHAWYRGEQGGEPLPPPPQADIDGYVSIFQPDTLTASALKSFEANAKKGSIRLRVAAYLASKRFLHGSHPLRSQLAIPKTKKKAKTPTGSVPANPYFDFWAWSCRNLEWCGPVAEVQPRSHHVLPVFMHHFGCAVPSHEALRLLKVLAQGRAVADVGSGNGYWAFMLRSYGVTVVPIDSAQSEWRVTWVGDTVKADGAMWLRRNKEQSKDMVLLMVYPIVGGGVAGGVEGGFTRDLLAAYQGDTVAVVGTQNHNGYTSFRGMAMDEFMQREHPDWTKVVQIPLPSFAGKDEALFVFQRGESAGQT
ncbi:hypothetical protein QBC46DRAFT_149618 [Diplogelasinospora grovesii]|uniref:Uncharacterized protein n=1 Tax=Diplogelasinospora grovesii TaxID=303347 RepID=A0AAN6N602_9PEZI|nr:hypothetical protein QBC46DRAFT_149618 [Diplogelasinospora grovesii]